MPGALRLSRSRQPRRRSKARSKARSCSSCTGRWGHSCYRHGYARPRCITPSRMGWCHRAAPGVTGSRRPPTRPSLPTPSRTSPAAGTPLIRMAALDSWRRAGIGCAAAMTPRPSVTRTAAGFEVAEDGDEPPRYAFLGVRPCDLRAIEIQDRVLGQPGSRYAQRRSAAFIIAVNCTEPGETCFCASMSAGPGTDGSGFDLALTELPGETGHRFLVDTGSQRGAEVLGRVPSEAADDATLREARGEVEAAADQMGRQMKAGGLRELMAAVEAADKPVGGLTVEPDALGPGLREWFGSLGRYPVKAAAFDTRMLGPAVLTGRASKGWPGCCARTVSMWPRSRRASWSPSRTGSSSTRPPGPGSGGSKLAARLAPS